MMFGRELERIQGRQRRLLSKTLYQEMILRQFGFEMLLKQADQSRSMINARWIRLGTFSFYEPID
mgnify:CR=1 FL=1